MPPIKTLADLAESPAEFRQWFGVGDPEGAQARLATYRKLRTLLEKVPVPFRLRVEVWRYLEEAEAEDYQAALRGPAPGD
jgi:hypothetical protein